MYQVGDIVWDDLTRSKATIVGVQVCQGKCDGVLYHGTTIGYWVDNDWVGGGRHPWELSECHTSNQNAEQP